MDFKGGQSIKGYEIVNRIGSGESGAVYRAHQTTLGREVAVKMILPGYANQPEFIRRFETEAQLVARLEHLHIVPLYDYWRDPDGAYLVMRWMRGGSLKDALVHGPYALNQTARALDQVAAGLATAHAAEIVHRDLKPSNILLDEEGNAYLSDFGIAKVLGQAQEHLSNTPVTLGSSDYISPEQARGQPVTPQTDIYGLGVTLYEMLTGEHPFPGLNAVERLFRHINEPLPRVETLDPLVAGEVNEVIQRATAKNPRYRYNDVMEMAAAFHQAARLVGAGQVALVESLTLREQEVLQLIVRGMSNREIAEALFVELSTVKWYIRQIYPKMGVSNRRQAIMRARDLNLLVTIDSDDVFADGDSSISLVLPAPSNPYKGLRPFETADARDFFGREKLIQDLLTRLVPKNSPGRNSASRSQPLGQSLSAKTTHRFLAIVGPSGSGKSSLVRAGLIPALARGEVPGSERWFTVQMTPGARPLDQLEVALVRIAANMGNHLYEQLERDSNGLLRAADIILPKDNSELVLVIDQFEELFTLTTEEAVRKHFLDLLVTAVTAPRSRVRLIITLRADYFDRPLHYPAFGDLVRSHMETLLPLSAEALEQAIVAPAQQVGVSCEPGLAATIIDDVLYQPGGLPLLQFALTELFEQRNGRTLTLQAYQAIGGVIGALAKRAEDLYQEQDGIGQELIRQIFLRLVAADESQDSMPDTRRRVLRAEIHGLTEDEDLIDEILNNYAGFRLLTLDHEPASRRPTVEVAHEALLREWERLRQWLEDSRQDLYQRRRLQVLSQEWLESGRDPGLLLQQTRLDQFASWAANTGLALTRDEQAFLDASLEAHHDQRAAEEARRLKELETARKLAETERQRAEAQTDAANRLRRRAVYLGIAVFLATLLALVAIGTSRQSVLNARQAQNNAAIANTQQALAAERAAAAATAEAIAQEQRQISETERDNAEAALLAAANAEAIAIQARQAAEAQARLAAARELSLAAINNLDIDPELSILLALQAVKRTYAADGFALPEAESALHQSLMNLRLEQVLPGSTAETCHQAVWCSDVAYSQDGLVLIASGPENTAVAWNLVTGERVFTVDGHAGPVTALALSPEGTYLATGGADGLAIVWEFPFSNTAAVLDTPGLILAGHTAEVTGVVFSPDGARIATASRDNTIRLWDASTGQELTVFAGHAGSVRDIAFSPDGRELFSASSDSTARIWDVARGQVRLTLAGHTDRITGLALSADGSKLATASWDSTVRLWNVVDGTEILRLPGDEARVYAVAISPDGTRLATAGTDAVINLWDLETGEAQLALPGHKGIIYHLSFSPDGTYLASGAGDGTTRVWDISPAGNREWLTLDGHQWVIFGVDFSPSGAQLATASWDGSVKVWDVQTGTELMSLIDDEWRKYSVEYSPDGSQLVTTAHNDTTVLWDATSGEALHTLRGHNGPVLDVAFSPDGHLLATVGGSQETPGLVNLWNTQTGQLERTWSGHEASVERVAISPDGQLIATASTDGTAKIWQLASGGLIATLSEHQAAVNSVNFSHDGRYLATAGYDNIARIWEWEGDNFVEVTVLSGHGSAVWDAVFSVDDRQVATISFDGTVKLWDLESETEVLTLPGEGNNGREVAFSPDGKYLAASTGSGLVPIFILPVEHLLAQAESRVTRQLTSAECRQYLHVDSCPVDDIR
jgi:WD40 repeat protein/serine/threonine protein kinase